MRSVLMVVVVASFACFHASAQASERTLLASNGARLPAPPMDALDCEQMQDLLYLYSASDYRAPGVIPSDGPDKTVFDYENALATHQYESCHLGRNDFASPTPTFGLGFN